MPIRPPMHRAPGALSPQDDRRKQSKEADGRRLPRRQRGYDSIWERFRLVRLAEEPLCQAVDPRERDAARYPYCTRPATEVHHIERIADRPDLRLARENTVCLCKPHHSAITAVEDMQGHQSRFSFVLIEERKL